MPPQPLHGGRSVGAGAASGSDTRTEAGARSESDAWARTLLLRAAAPDRGGKFMMALRRRKNASPANGLVKKSAMLAVVETNGTISSSFSTITEERVEAGRVPQLVDGDEGVLEVGRAADAAERHAELALAVVQDHHLEVAHPLAHDVVALSVDHDVVAWAHVRQVLNCVVDVPRAAAVDDHVHPAGHRMR